jgi:hypothetical protein
MIVLENQEVIWDIYIFKLDHFEIVKLDAGESMPFVDNFINAQGIFNDLKYEEILIDTGGKKLILKI